MEDDLPWAGEAPLTPPAPQEGSRTLKIMDLSHGTELVCCQEKSIPIAGRSLTLWQNLRWGFISPGERQRGQACAVSLPAEMFCLILLLHEK